MSTYAVRLDTRKSLFAGYCTEVRLRMVKRAYGVHYVWLRKNEYIHRVSERLRDKPCPLTRISPLKGYWSGKYYPSYAWLIVNNFAQEQWRNLLHQWTINCTKSQLDKVLNYSVVFEAVPMENNDDRHMSTSGLVSVCFKPWIKLD